jgi:uncharacterized protein YjeT (DUF2065 family)
MKRTRLSFYYLIGYLVPASLALLLVPRLALKLLLASGDYGDVMPRLVGMALLALGVLVIQIVRYRLEMLYTTVLAVRGGMLVILLSLYFYSRDPFFVILFLVVGFGFVLTSVSLWLDRRSNMASQPQAS